MKSSYVTMMSSYYAHYFLCISIILIDLITCDNITVHYSGGSYSLRDTDVTTSDHTIREVQSFHSISTSGSNDFKTMLIEDSYMVLGGRNILYNISLSDLDQQWNITWESSEVDVQTCRNSQQSVTDCYNYIRVIQRRSEHQLFVCGTNAYKPYCRTYQINEAEGRPDYFTVADIRGIGKCPHDPRENSTALLIDDRLYSATTADKQGRDSLILGSPTGDPQGGSTDLLPTLRTEQYDSQWLNKPNHVKSFEFGDMVYFLFSEIAVEYINCGKKVVSGVGRVCKNDAGGGFVLRQIFTSFFKARFNCSVPGDFPFYFDEIQSASNVGKGNFMPTISPLDNRTDMFYAVFNTPENSIHGSAVCAFRMADVLSVFEGPFKEQKNPNSNWLPVSDIDTPQPHPAKSCSNDSSAISARTLNFIKTHTLMDKVIPSYGGVPVFQQASSSFRLTKIAIDYQVHAADGRYYDVMYIGTDHGHVIKAINKGVSGVGQVVIEDIQVFRDKSPVNNIEVYRSRERGEEKLVIVSENEVKAIPLQRCHVQNTCSDCVALQDPYCSWYEGRCMYSTQGHQSISTGQHHECRDTPTTTRVLETAPVTCPPCPTCATSAPSTERDVTTPTPTDNDVNMLKTIYEGPNPTTGHQIPPAYDAKTGEVKGRSDGLIYSAADMAIAVVLSLFAGAVLPCIIFLILKLLRHKHKQQQQRRPKTTNLETKNLEGQENLYLQTVPTKAVANSVPKYTTNSLKSYADKPLNNLPSVNLYHNDLKPSLSSKTVNESVVPRDAGTPSQTSRKFYV